MDYTSLLQQPFLTAQARYNTATKSFDLGTSPLSDFWYTSPKSEDDPEPVDLLRTVPWLWHGVGLRANSVADMPFQIETKAGDVIESTEDWQGVYPWLGNVRRLLYLTEAALTCYGRAYYWRERNRVTTTGIRYIRPDTVDPQIDGDKGLTAFVRTANGKRLTVPVNQIVYFWQADPYVELGPPEGSPLLAAIAAAGVLRNLDRFASAYFARGAIKATLLTVSGAPVKAERDRLKEWWKQLVTGVKNAWATEIVNADSVTPVVIGEGLKELSNAQLTEEKRQDIAQALGIPLTVMFSDSASGLGGGGVAVQDNKHFYEKTIIPECRFIEDVLNEQLFAPMGLRWRFLPNSLDVFQEDENERAAAFGAYVTAGLPIEVVGPMLGVELPEGWTWEKVKAEKEEAARQAQEAMQQAGPPGQQDDEDDERDAKALADLRRWRTKSAKRGKLADFVSDFIPAAVADDIKTHAVNGWRDALDGVIAVYEGEDGAQPEPAPAKSIDVAPLVDALTRATEALLNGHAQPVD